VPGEQLSRIRQIEIDANELVFTRAALDNDDLATTIRTLNKIGGVDLSDLVQPPGFDENGNADADRPEWLRWSDANEFADTARQLAWVLVYTAEELGITINEPGPRRSASQWNAPFPEQDGKES
jgi:hypothetical protein